MLADAPIEILGRLQGASNHTLLVRLGGDDDALAVYKPRVGERPLWDFPRGTLHRREVAASRLSDHLGWGLVPTTVLRDGPLGEGSLQQFVPHDPSLHYFVVVEDAAQAPALVRLAVLDLLLNNADRKGSHILVAADDGRLVAIDNGLSFHVEAKLRTVVWDLGAAPVPASLRTDLAGLAPRLDGDGPARAMLEDLLAPAEIAALAARARRLATLERLPDPPPEQRPYPWPPL